MIAPMKVEELLNQYEHEIEKYAPSWVKQYKLDAIVEIRKRFRVLVQEGAS